MEKSSNFQETLKDFLEYGIDEIIFNDVTPKINIAFPDSTIDLFHQELEQSEIEERLIFPSIEQTLRELVTIKNEDDVLPTIYVRDPFLFFEYLTEITEQLLLFEEKFKEENAVDSFITLQRDIFRLLSLRMTPSDFHNVESFLEFQLDSIKDKTFDDYMEFKQVGMLDKYPVYAKMQESALYDESNKQMHFRIYSEDGYSYSETHHVLYDIRTEKENKVCYIGGIQNKEGKRKTVSKIERLFYKANKGVFELESEEYKYYKNEISDYCPSNISEVNLSSLMSAAIFTNMLIEEGITKIKIPLIHHLTFDYHKIMSNKTKDDFYDKWDIQNEERMENKIKNILDQESQEYIDDKNVFLSYVNKEPLISKIKTENLFHIFDRLSYHYSNIEEVSKSEEAQRLEEISYNNIKRSIDSYSTNLEIIEDPFDRGYDYLEIRMKHLDHRMFNNRLFENLYQSMKKEQCPEKIKKVG